MLYLMHMITHFSLLHPVLLHFKVQCGLDHTLLDAKQNKVSFVFVVQFGS